MSDFVTAEMLTQLVEALKPVPAPGPGAPPLLPPRPAYLTGAVVCQTMNPETPQEIAKLRSALSVLSADVPRGNGRLYEPGEDHPTGDYWLMAVWAIGSLGWQCGKELARSWSKQSDRYTDEGFEAAWNAYDPSRPNTVGIGSLYKLAKSHGWSPPTDASTVAANDSRYKVLSTADIRRLPSLQWRVKHVLPATGIAAIYGPSASGKSFLALDVAAAIALGNPWFGHRTYQAPVVYVMLEGEGAIRNRIAALEIAKGAMPSGGFGVIAQTFLFAEGQDVEDMASVIPPGAVVFVDTLNRAAPTTDENSSKEMGIILQAAKQLQAATEGLVVVVHHTGKDTTKGPRGHSSLFAALDAAIEVERTAKGRMWSIAKAKDGQDGQQVGFKLETHAIGQDDDGDDITSCSVAPDDSKLFSKPEPKGEKQRLALKIIKSTFISGQVTTTGMAGCPAGTLCMLMDDLIDQVAPMLSGTKGHKLRHEARRLVTALLDSGHLDSGVVGDQAWVWLG